MSEYAEREELETYITDSAVPDGDRWVLRAGSIADTLWDAGYRKGLQVIPDAAVDAAHKAWRAQAALDGSIFEYNLRAALEAAAPHLMRTAWDEGWEAHGDWGGPTPNPYRTAK